MVVLSKMVTVLRSTRWRKACGVLALASAGCATFLGGNEGILDELDAGADGGIDAAVAPDASTGADVSEQDAPSPPLDAGPDARDAASDAPPPCSGDAGPQGVRVGDFCVDSTEVTNADYQAFLAAKGSDAGGQPATCQWNTTYTPTTWPPPAASGSVPVAFVDWCDAFAFCAWANKRLCGAPDGGSVGFSDFANASASQWFAACSHAADGQHAYPYGNAYAPAACNAADSNDAGTLVDAASFPGCVGGYPGVFDMSGNAAEWEDSCLPGDGAAPQSDPCRTRGGAVDDDAGGLACASAGNRGRATATARTGFRCCTR